ncbi:MAG: hypothetical protein FJZ80_07030 [Bacteroidetes bacterium]|nr:hypothetical protein [Bacteroidota bacterium]
MKALSSFVALCISFYHCNQVASSAITGIGKANGLQNPGAESNAEGTL